MIKFPLLCLRIPCFPIVSYVLGLELAENMFPSSIEALVWRFEVGYCGAGSLQLLTEARIYHFMMQLSI